MDIRGYFRKAAYEHYRRGAEPITLPEGGNVWLLGLFWTASLAMAALTAAVLLRPVPVMVRAAQVETLPEAGACPAPARRVRLTLPGLGRLTEGVAVRGKVAGEAMAGWVLRREEACLAASGPTPAVAAWTAEATVAQVEVAWRPVGWYFRRMFQLGDGWGARP